MSEQYTKVEIIERKWNAEDWGTNLFAYLLSLAVLTLITWWFFATWFPELGYTYWQLVLPVFVFRALISRKGISPRKIDK